MFLSQFGVLTRRLFSIPHTEVSDDEVTGIYEGLENLFDTALNDPMSIYPIKVDMGELYEIKEFIKEGSFTVEHASS
jgi:hypothetical protein